jgi:hypothetical protein
MASASKSLPDGWQDKTIIGLSILLAASPWLLGYADLAAAKWNAIVLAATFAAGSAAVLLWEPYWPDFITAFMAFWLAGSSRVLTFTDHLAPTVVAAVVGIAVLVLALWSAIARARALYFAAHPVIAGVEPPVEPPTAPNKPRKAA